ncbi:type II secretion system protein [Candidatus Wolfebacteria bacterium]|nr:type II secretion system protein [Candidatus Wolfebacteria bacterium]
MKGFTLIELLIVISITAILAVGVSSFNLFGYRNKQDLDLTAREIVVILRNAQDRSISQESGGNYGVYFDNIDANGAFYDLFNGASYSSGTIIKKIPLKNNISFVIPQNGASSSVVFSPLSGIPVSSSTVAISLKSDILSSSTIIINSNGNISF